MGASDLGSIFAGESLGAASTGAAVGAGAKGAVGEVGAVESAAAPPLDSAAVAQEVLPVLLI